MHNQDVSHWQQAMTLYRDVLTLPEHDRVTHIEQLDVASTVKDKLNQLLQSSATLDKDPLLARLDHLVLKLGSSMAGQGNGNQDNTSGGNAAMIGRRVGAWTILKPLGHGGMASVFEAERSEVEFDQHGALKLLSLLMLATGGSHRFVREQQFLAQLQHPNIAMLLDGGVAEDGTPFLVTELVSGCDIREYCSLHNLNLQQIVRLLLQVCAAISHAHGNLILHRDIKPSNVMVTSDGQIKLLDFGIGKLTEEAVEGTQTIAFSPKYAAPEQVTGGAITTTTDVYGLGMLGHSLLEQKPLVKQSPTQLSGQSSEQHELEQILDMATREEPIRRYASAESMANDLNNWLHSRPIKAVADSLGYRLRKYLRRNQKLVLASGAIVLTAVIGVAAVLWQANQARIEAQKAQTMAGFMIDLFASGDLLSGQGPDTSIASLMDAGAQRARIELDNAPEARTEILRVIGLAQTEFGQYQQAGENLQAAMTSAVDPIDRARVLGAMGVWSAERAEFKQGIDWMQQALEIMTTELPPEHPDRLEIELNMINFLLFTGQYQNSMQRADKLIAAIGNLEQLPQDDHANVLRSRAMALTQVDRFGEAIQNLHQAIDIARQLRPPRPALVAAFVNDLGIANSYGGYPQASIDAFRESYQIQSDIYGPAHKRTITSGSNLVHLMRGAGKTDAALQLGNEVFNNSLAEYGPIHRSVVLTRLALALVLSDLSRDAEADIQLANSITALRQLDDMRSELPHHLAWRGEILIRADRFDEAIELLQEAEAIRDTEFPDEARRYRVAAQRRLVHAHAALGQCETANAYLNNISEDIAGGEHGQAMATRIYLLNCQVDQASARQTYRHISESINQLEDLTASLRAALRWGHQHLMG